MNHEHAHEPPARLLGRPGDDQGACLAGHAVRMDYVTFTHQEVCDLGGARSSGEVSGLQVFPWKFRPESWTFQHFRRQDWLFSRGTEK